MMKQQKVLTIKTSSVHPKLGIYFKSARLIDVDSYKAMEHSFNQIKN